MYVIGRKGLGYYTFRKPPGRGVVDRLLRAADLRRRREAAPRRCWPAFIAGSRPGPTDGR